MSRHSLIGLLLVSALLVPQWAHATAVSKISKSLQSRSQDATTDLNMVPVSYTGKDRQGSLEDKLQPGYYTVPHYGSLDPNVQLQPTDYAGLLYYLDKR